MAQVVNVMKQGPHRVENRRGIANFDAKEAEVEYVGIDWASRQAAWCALDPAGELLGEGVIAADLDGLTARSLAVAWRCRRPWR